REGFERLIYFLPITEIAVQIEEPRRKHDLAHRLGDPYAFGLRKRVGQPFEFERRVLGCESRDVDLRVGAAPDGVLDVLALACKLGEEELSARGCVFRCLWIEGLELRFRGRRGRNRQRPPGGGLSCVGRKREVESVLGTVTAESHLCGNLSRQ